MKNKFLNPLAVMAVATFTMYGCASSNETANSTAGTAETGVMEETSMNETATMAGNTSDKEFNDLDVMVFRERVMVPVGTLSVTALAMENPVEVDEMFEEIEDTEQYDVLALARTSPNLSTFVKLIEQAGLVNDLQRVEEVTIFAPTNEAFAKLPKETLTKMLSSDNVATLSALLQVHILSSDIASAQLQDNTRIRVTDSSYIPVSAGIAGRNTSVGGAQLIKTDVKASNGRIHVIDSVILPSQDFIED